MKHTQLGLARVPNLRRAGKALFALAVILLLASVAFRQAQYVALAQGDYDLSWFTVDGGGGTCEGGSYVLSGAVGQPDAGLALTRGGYTLVGGLWSGAVAGPGQHPVYLPLVLKNH